MLVRDLPPQGREPWCTCSRGSAPLSRATSLEAARLYLKLSPTRVESLHVPTSRASRATRPSPRGCCGAQPGRLLWRTGPPPSTVPHPTASMGVTNGATLAAASTHDTQTHHLPPTLYEEPFHPCNICTGVPPTLKRPAPTRVVLGDPQTTNTSTRGCSMCPGGASP